MNETNGQVFQSVVKGNNFMTPDLVGYYQSGPYHIEISRGGGLEQGTVTPDTRLFGVTVANDHEHLHDLGQCFGTLDEAMKYAENLPNLRVSQVI